MVMVVRECHRDQRHRLFSHPHTVPLPHFGPRVRVRVRVRARARARARARVRVRARARARARIRVGIGLGLPTLGSR